MAEINWGLAQNGAQNALAMGLQLGNQVRQSREAAAQREHQNALLAFRQQEQQQQAVRREQEQRRADIPLVTRLLETSTDDASYQRNLGIAQQYGISVQGLPSQFDPAWRDQQLATMKALQDPQKKEALSSIGRMLIDMGFEPGTPEFHQRALEMWTAEQVKTIPYTEGGGVAGYNAATGKTETIIAPNPGGFTPGAPVRGGGVQDGATATNPQTGEKIIYRNGQWQPVGQGGGGARVTSNFLDGI